MEIDDVELIESVLSDGVDPWSLVMLAGIDPETLLDPIHRVCYLRAMDAVGAYVAARQQRALVAVAGSASSGDLRTARGATSRSPGPCARSSGTPRRRWSAARSASSTPPRW